MITLRFVCIHDGRASRLDATKTVGPDTMTDAVGGEYVLVGVPDPRNESGEAEAAQVIGHAAQLYGEGRAGAQ